MDSLVSPCELDVEPDGDYEEDDAEDAEDDHHGGGCGEGALGEGWGLLMITDTYLCHYRQTLAAVHPVIGVARLTFLPLLGPAPALTHRGVPDLESGHFSQELWTILD